ncbi:hypothetical protein FKP32DRAFT_1579487 [Trametes sanguinea]|nr:hypothetical protein FKP32DRAFT_1579487 [Trametes sanguinea]
MSTSSGPLASLLETFKTGIGSWFVGGILTTLLVGMLLQQTFRYFRLYPGDPVYMKAWVWSLYYCMSPVENGNSSTLLGRSRCVSSRLTAMHPYYYLITHYLNLTVFARSDVWCVWALMHLSPGAYDLSDYRTAPVTGLTSRRDRILHRFVSSLCLDLSPRLSRPAAPQNSTISTRVSQARRAQWIINVASVLLLLGDVQLTVVLVYALHRCRSGIRRTDSMVDILIAYAISSGTSAVTSLQILYSLAHPYDYRLPYMVRAMLVTSEVVFRVSLNTLQFVRSRGELDDTNLDSAFVLGEKAPSGTAVNRVELPLTSMVFAAGPSQSQLSSAALGDTEDGSIGQSSKTRTQVIDGDKDKEHSDVEAASV